jgi:hypothetical protein
LIEIKEKNSQVAQSGAKYAPENDLKKAIHQ